MEGYLSAKESADYLDVSIRQIRYLCTGRIVKKKNKIINYPAKFHDVKTSVSIKNRKKYFINQDDVLRFKGSN